MSHTPGPWYVIGPPWDDGDCSVYSAPDPHRGKFICATDEGQWHGYSPDDKYEWQCNATLIAAAPELLAACEEIYRYWRETDTVIRPIVEVTKAIAKAKGIPTYDVPIQRKLMPDIIPHNEGG